MTAYETISRVKIVPVVKIDNASDTQNLLGALDRGGIPVAEITFRTACAAEAIEYASQNFPEMIIGAGTVTNTEQAEKAVYAGAEFIVGPGWSDSVAEFCKSANILYLPGCVTPTEIMKAMDMGINVVKFFPASVYGGLKAIKALAAPFTGVKFVPTGGVNALNLAEYLAFDKVVAVGGSWMVDGKLVKEGRFDEIERLAREAKTIADSVR